MRWLVLLAALANPAAAEIRPVQRPAAEVAILSSESSIQLASGTTPQESVRPMRRVAEEARQRRVTGAARPFGRAAGGRVRPAADVGASRAAASRGGSGGGADVEGA